MPEVGAKVLKKTGDVIADVASQTSPFLTGALSASHRAEFLNDSTVIVGSATNAPGYSVEVDYGPYQNEQTAYFDISFNEKEPTMVHYMRQEIEAEIERNKV